MPTSINDLYAKLEWTPWLEFTKDELKKCSSEQGIYRIRPESKNFLMYIGETGDLRKRLQTLRCNYTKQEMPFNDPHTAAPSLWAWQDAKSWSFEWSIATTSFCNILQRKSLETLLLYKYREEKNESTLCNFGRFHEQYCKSTGRSGKKRGYKLTNEKNPAGEKSFPVLKKAHKFPHENWMGLEWSPYSKLVNEKVSQIPIVPGVYLITDTNKQNLLYVGQTTKLRNRLYSHITNFSEFSPDFSWAMMPQKYTRSHQLKECENDLIGAYIIDNGNAPILQYEKEI